MSIFTTPKDVYFVECSITDFNITPDIDIVASDLSQTMP